MRTLFRVRARVSGGWSVFDKGQSPEVKTRNCRSTRTSKTISPLLFCMHQPVLPVSALHGQRRAGQHYDSTVANRTKRRERSNLWLQTSFSEHALITLLTGYIVIMRTQRNKFQVFFIRSQWFQKPGEKYFIRQIKLRKACLIQWFFHIHRRKQICIFIISVIC